MPERTRKVLIAPAMGAERADGSPDARERACDTRIRECSLTVERNVLARLVGVGHAGELLIGPGRLIRNDVPKAMPAIELDDWRNAVAPLPAAAAAQALPRAVELTCAIQGKAVAGAIRGIGCSSGAGIDDNAISGEDAVRKEALAQMQPEALDRIEFRGIAAR